MQGITPSQDTPAETTRRLENIARLGTVVAVRHRKPARCRVRMGDNTTDWLPWHTGRAGGSKGSHWWPPVVGEQCIVLSPGGDLSQGLVLLGAYSDAMDAPSDTPESEYTNWGGGNFAEFKNDEYTVRTQRTIRFEVGTASITITPTNITLRAGGATVQIGPVKVTSNVDVVAAGISVAHHAHGGVSAGEDATGEPLP